MSEDPTSTRSDRKVSMNEQTLRLRPLPPSPCGRYKRPDEPSEYRWSPLFMYTCNPGGVTKPTTPVEESFSNDYHEVDVPEQDCHPIDRQEQVADHHRLQVTVDRKKNVHLQ
ncbi:hypothetical protein EVAR_31033_1 [Eumeta japonica]|uniref:Uncharacterized protein n=1 Tax=Eumeta variegata TaxID=151549 RepID=A0A4C1VH22_EUMVA|nr:hypothetical protein EVAR_31033_1 [Eumeta japonica]